MGGFRWNEWNLDHLEKHDVTPEEAEELVEAARRPYPEKVGDGKYRVRGQTASGRYLQVIFIIDPLPRAFYVIHARDLTFREIQQHRRRIR